MVFGFIRPDKTKHSGEFSRIIDPVTCKEWLATLVPLDAEANLQTLTVFLGEVVSGTEQAKWTAERKFMVLERVRALLMNVLLDRLHETENRTTLLTSEEGVRLWLLIEAVASLCDAYGSLVSSLPSRDEVAVPDKTDDADTQLTNVDVLHCAIDLSALILSLNQRARMSVPQVFWNRHCHLGQLVRQLDCHDVVIRDRLRLAQTDTCRKAFVSPILIALADPATLSLGELNMVVRATQLWAGRIAFRIDPGTTINLTARSESKPGPCVYLGESRVRFDSQSLMRNLTRMLTTLDDGMMPKEWIKENGITASKALLQLLKRRWGTVEPEDINYPEIAWRPPSLGAMLAVIGWQEDTKSRPQNLTLSDYGGTRSIYDYQRLREDRLSPSQEQVEQQRLEKLLGRAETWNLVGETADALLCARRLYRPSLYLNQLVGIKLGGEGVDTPYLLAWVQGLQQAVSEDQAGLLRPSSTHLIRLRLFPGRVRSMRVMLEQGSAEAYLVMPLDFHDVDGQVELLLHEIQVATQRFSVVLPVASYAQGRSLKLLLAGEEMHFKIGELIARGLDFDHVTIDQV